MSPNSTSRFIRACLRQPVDRTPVWFLRQAGRYMPEYMAVRKHHSLLDICRTPAIAAEVTITAAERLGVDAAIIFADLLLPLTPMGLDFEFVNGEGPVSPPAPPHPRAGPRPPHRPHRRAPLRRRAIEQVATHFNNKRPRARTAQDTLGIIGFCGAPFTLASYMIEGGSSRNYIETKKLMYVRRRRLARSSWTSSSPSSPTSPPNKSKPAPTSSRSSTPGPARSPSPTTATTPSPPPPSSSAASRPSASPSSTSASTPPSLLPTMRETGADVLGLDWRIPLDPAWRALGLRHVAVQGNLDPITLFAPEDVLEARVAEILAAAAGRPGHIFNLGHGIVPNTPVDAVLRVVDLIKRHGQTTPRAPHEATSDWAIRA